MIKSKKFVALFAVAVIAVAGAVTVSAGSISYDIRPAETMTAVEKNYESNTFSTVYSQTNPKTVTSSLTISVAPNTTARTGKVDGYIYKKTFLGWSKVCSVPIKSSISIPNSANNSYLAYTRSMCGTGTVTMDANTEYKGMFKETALASPSESYKVTISPHLYVDINV